MTFRRQLVRIAIALAICSVARLGSAASSCDALDPCAAKTCRLDADILQAKTKASSGEVARLQRARAEMAHCSDDGLRQKRKVALQQAQRRIDVREAELKKFEASGDAAKVKKAQRKLESARKAYEEIENSPL